MDRVVPVDPLGVDKGRLASGDGEADAGHAWSPHSACPRRCWLTHSPSRLARPPRRRAWTAPPRCIFGRRRGEHHCGHAPVARWLTYSRSRLTRPPRHRARKAPPCCISRRQAARRTPDASRWSHGGAPGVWTPRGRAPPVRRHRRGEAAPAPPKSPAVSPSSSLKKSASPLAMPRRRSRKE